MPYIMTRLDKQLKLRAFEKKQAYIPIGSAMKARRIANKWTLEEVCENICSVSYLSKLENNLVEMSEKFRDELLKKLGLEDYNFHVYARTDNDLSQCLEMILEKRIDTSDIYEFYKDKLDYQSSIILMVMSYMNDNLLETNQRYDDLLPYVSQFTDFEVSVFTYINACVLNQQGFYEQALMMIKRSFYHVVNHKQLTLLSNKLKLSLFFRIHRHTELLKLYDAMFKSLANAHRYEELKDIQIGMLIYQTQHQSINDITEQVDHICKIDDSTKNYILARSYYHHHQYDKVFQLMSQHPFDTDRHTQLYLMTLDRLDQAPETILKVIKGFHSERFEDVQLKLYLKNKKKLSDSLFAEYLKREFFNQALVVEDFFVLHYLALDGQACLSRAHFYKDATKVMHHYVRTMHSLTGSGVSNE